MAPAGAARPRHGLVRLPLSCSAGSLPALPRGACGSGLVCSYVSSPGMVWVRPQEVVVCGMAPWLCAPRARQRACWLRPSRTT